MGRVVQTLEGERRQRAAERVQLSAELASATQVGSIAQFYILTNRTADAENILGL
jgi:hypothetical protein